MKDTDGLQSVIYGVPYFIQRNVFSERWSRLSPKTLKKNLIVSPAWFFDLLFQSCTNSIIANC